jgi:hypothetical protein
MAGETRSGPSGASPTFRREDESFSAGGTTSCGKFRIHIEGPGGVTACELGTLLVALEDLWRSMSGDENGALRVIEIGTGSVWARISAECQNAPVATFGVFMSVVSAATSPILASASVPHTPVAKYSPYEPSAKQKVENACKVIVGRGGAVTIDKEAEDFLGGKDVDWETLNSFYGDPGLQKEPSKDEFANMIAKRKAQFNYGYKTDPSEKDPE